MANYIGSVDPYVSGDFTVYEDRVKQFMKANKVEEEIKTSVFISIMGNDMYETLKSLMVPEVPSEKSFDELIEVLKKIFVPKTNKRAERYKFNKAAQKDGESISEFIARLKTLAKDCKFGEGNAKVMRKVLVKKVETKDGSKAEIEVNIDGALSLLMLDEALTDRFIVGLSNQKTQQKLLNSEDLDFEDCCAVALNMESSQRETKALPPIECFMNQGNSSWQVQPHSYSTYEAMKRAMLRSGASSGSVNKAAQSCFRCGRTHNAATCPAVSWKCFVCNRVGHTSRVCRLKSAGTKQSRSAVEFTRLKHFKIDENLCENLGSLKALKREMFRKERGASATPVNEEPLGVDVIVENESFTMEVDSGTCASVMSQQEYEDKYSSLDLLKVADMMSKFKLITGECISALGRVNVRVYFGAVMQLLSLFVLALNAYFRALIGRPWLNALCPEWKEFVVKV